MEKKREQFQAEHIQELKLKLGYVDLTIVEAEENAEICVEIEAEELREYSAQVCGETLTVHYEKNKKIFWGNENRARMFLWLPKGIVLKNFVLEIGAGKGELQQVEIVAEKMNLKIGAGDVRIGSAKVSENLELEVGAGNFACQKLDAANVKVECGVGDCEIHLVGKETDYNYKLSCGIGKIAVNRSVMQHIGANETSMNQDAMGMIKLNCGVGNIRLYTA